MGVRSILAGALALAGLGTGAIAAPPTDADESSTDRIEAIDAFVTEQMRELHIPGLALALIEDGQVVYEHGYGVADTSGRAVTPTTPFLIASTSKQFTGIAVQQLVLEGKLDLDAPIGSYLPVFASADEAHRSITVRQLLGHTSGYSIAHGVENHMNVGGPNDTLEANARRLASEPLAHEPGAGFEYTDANYDLLGYIVEEVAGVPYAQYLQEQVLNPLNMHGTYTNQADAERAGLAEGFYPWFGYVSVPTRVPCSESGLPSACMVSSAHDLAQIVLAQLGDLSALDAEVLAATRVPLTRENDAVEYASGWHVHRFWPLQTEGDPNNPALPMMYEHGGNAPSYASFMAYVPDRQFGIAITANADDRVVASPWRNFVFDTMRVAIGTPPRMAGPTEDLVRQFARLLYVLAILLQLAASIWSFRARRRGVATGIAALVNVAVVGFMVAYPPITAGVAWVVLLWITPDAGWLTVLAMLVALAWLVLLVIRTAAVRRDGMRLGANRSAPGAGAA